MMRVDSSKLREKEQYDYIHVDQENNVHLLVPFVGGDTIGLDNTCELTKAAQRFWGKEVDAAIKSRSALHVLKRMQQDLQSDIALLQGKSGYIEIFSTKSSRLEQINQYITTLEAIQNDTTLRCLNSGYAYPQVVNQILAEKSNCFAMRLSPHEEDPYVRAEAPLFRLKRLSDRDEDYCGRGFGDKLWEEFEGVDQLVLPEPSTKNSILDSVQRRFGTAVGAGYNQVDDIIAYMTEAMKKSFPQLDSSFTLSKTYDLPESEINQDFLENEVWTLAKTHRPREVATQILGYAVAPDTWDILSEQSPFTQFGNNRERLSIMTQFYLALINAHVCAYGISRVNFGEILDNDNIPPLWIVPDFLSSFDFSLFSSTPAEKVARTVLCALPSGSSVEEKLVAFVNRNKTQFSMSRALSPAEQQTITSRFREQYLTIKNSRHFDEFIVFLPEVRGNCANHQHRISSSFAESVMKGFPQQMTPFYRTKLKQFSQLGTRLYHKNTVWSGVDQPIYMMQRYQNHGLFSHQPTDRQNRVVPQMKDILAATVASYYKIECHTEITLNECGLTIRFLGENVLEHEPKFTDPECPDLGAYDSYLMVTSSEAQCEALELIFAAHGDIVKFSDFFRVEPRLLYAEEKLDLEGLLRQQQPGYSMR